MRAHEDQAQSGGWLMNGSLNAPMYESGGGSGAIAAALRQTSFLRVVLVLAATVLVGIRLGAPNAFAKGWVSPEPRVLCARPTAPAIAAPRTARRSTIDLATSSRRGARRSSPG